MDSFLDQLGPNNPFPGRPPLPFFLVPQWEDLDEWIIKPQTKP